MADKVTYSYLVGVQIYYTHIGAGIVTAVVVNLDFRITQESLPVVLARLKSDLGKRDRSWAALCADPNATLNIVSFGRFEDE